VVVTTRTVAMCRAVDSRSSSHGSAGDFQHIQPLDTVQAATTRPVGPGSSGTLPYGLARTQLGYTPVTSPTETSLWKK
jgi:hypothetical protein